MIEFLSIELFSWIILNSVCGLIGGNILGVSNKAKLGVLLGVMLGPLGLVIVVLICQREQVKRI
jgi:uncharacterized membrane protein YeaQ/YmgE (transglycosylase-associated protein family)